VSHVRRLDRALLFTDAKSCDASVSTGMVFEGSDLKFCRPFCEMSLKWRKDDLETAIRKRTSFSECVGLAQELVDKIYQVSLAVCKLKS
jgi:hypothetical protein